MNEKTVFGRFAVLDFNQNLGLITYNFFKLNIKALNVFGLVTLVITIISKWLRYLTCSLSDALVSVHRYNVHGVSSGKIKRMLDTYERNVTAQSLYAMLPPLHYGRRARATADNTSDNSDHSQSQISAADNLKSSSSSAETYVTASFANSVVESSASLDSQYIVSSGEGVCSCPDTSSSDCVVTEAGGSILNNVAAPSLYNWFTPPSSPKSVCCDVVGTACYAPSVCELSVPAASSSVSSCELVSSSDTPVMSPFAVTTDVYCEDEQRTYKVSKQSDSESDRASDTLGEMAQTSGQLSRSKRSVLLSHRCSHDEATGIVTDPAECVGGISTSANKTDILCSSNDLEFESLPCTLTADGHGQLHVIDIQPPVYTESISQDQPACGTDTQSSDLTTEKAHTVLLTSSTVDVVKYSLSAESEAELDEKTGCGSLCDVNSVCSQRGSLESERSDSGLTAHKTVDCLLTQSLKPDVNHNEKYCEFTVHRNTAQADVLKRDRTEACCSDQNVDRGRTVQHSIGGDRTTKMSSAFTDKRLLCEVTADSLESSCNVTIQPDPESLTSDTLSGNEGKMKNAGIQCYNPVRVAELMYWGEMDADERLLSQSSDAQIHSVSDSVAEQHDEQGLEPKPQRRRLHCCQNKEISSLVESIWAGQEWISEHEHGFSASENSSLDTELSRYNIDQSTVKQCSISDECRSNSTQTEPHDFITLTKVTRDDELTDTTDYAAVVETSPRDISADCQVSPNVPSRSVLHKSCSTVDVAEDTETASQLNFLESCFPSISSRDLRELLANCRNDVVVAADLLLEFGYEYNEPQGDDVTGISSVSTSDTDSCLSDRSVVVKSSSGGTKSSRSPRSKTTALRLYKDSLISKGIELQSRNTQPRCQPPFTADIPAPSSYLCLNPLVLFFVFSNALLRICWIIICH